MSELQMSTVLFSHLQALGKVLLASSHLLLVPAAALHSIPRLSHAILSIHLRGCVQLSFHNRVPALGPILLFYGIGTQSICKQGLTQLLISHSLSHYRSTPHST